MSAILKFDFQKRKTVYIFSEEKLSKLHKKRLHFACDNYIFPKTRGNKNKQWTHYSRLYETKQNQELVCNSHFISGSFVNDLQALNHMSRI